MSETTDENDTPLSLIKIALTNGFDSYKPKYPSPVYSLSLTRASSQTFGTKTLAMLTIRLAPQIEEVWVMSETSMISEDLLQGSALFAAGALGKLIHSAIDSWAEENFHKGVSVANSIKVDTSWARLKSLELHHSSRWSETRPALEAKATLCYSHGALEKFDDSTKLDITTVRPRSTPKAQDSPNDSHSQFEHDMRLAIKRSIEAAEQARGLGGLAAEEQEEGDMREDFARSEESRTDSQSQSTKRRRASLPVISDGEDKLWDQEKDPKGKGSKKRR